MNAPIFELVGSAAVLVAGWLANKYIIPFLQIGKRHRYAQLIATLADDITDDLRDRYADSEWLNHLDEAVDTLIDILGIDDDIADRAIRAAAARKRPVAADAAPSAS